MQNAGAIWLSILGKVWKDKNDKIFQQGFFEIMIFFLLFLKIFMKAQWLEQSLWIFLL